MAFDPDKYLATKTKSYNPEAAPSAARSAAQLGKDVAARAPGFLSGVLNKTRETTSQPVLRFLANSGFKPAQEEIKALEDFRASHTPAPGEKMGEFAADVGMLMAPTPLSKAKAPTTLGKIGKLIGFGAQGAAQHQAQNYAKSGEVSPADAAGEVALTTGVMGAGSAIPSGLKNTAAGYLQLLTRAPKRLERGMNPPTFSGFKQALENKIFPILKGGYKAAEKRGIAKQVERDAEKVALLKDAGVRGNADEAVLEAEAAIAGRSGGRRGLLPSQKQSGTRQLDEYRGAAKDPYYGTNPADMEPDKFLDLRKMADENANFVAMKTPDGLDLASQEFRTAAENQLGRKMAGKGGERRYLDLKDQMAELAPVLEAFNEKAVSNYSFAPEAVTGAVGAMYGNPMLALIPAARRLPQVAPALYETGRAAGSKTAKRAGRTSLDLSRSALFGRDE